MSLINGQTVCGIGMRKILVGLQEFSRFYGFSIFLLRKYYFQKINNEKLKNIKNELAQQS